MPTTLTIECSPEAARELMRKYEAGELTELAGVVVLSVSREPLDELVSQQDYLLGSRLAFDMTRVHGEAAMVRDCVEVAGYVMRRETLPGACADADAGAFVRGYLDEALFIVSANEAHGVRR